MTLEDFLSGIGAIPPVTDRPTLTIQDEGDATMAAATVELTLDTDTVQTIIRGLTALAEAQAQTQATLDRIVDLLSTPVTPQAHPRNVTRPAATGDVAQDIINAWRSTFGENLGEKAQAILAEAAGGDLARILRAVQNVSEGIATGKAQKPNKPLAYVTATIRRMAERQGQAQDPVAPIGPPKGMTVITEDDEDLPF